MAFWFCIGWFNLAVVKGAQFELTALGDSARYATMLAVLGAAAACARQRTAWLAASDGAALQFEQAPSGEIIALGLNRDGAFRVDEK
jgi:hypothetical protein